jgi:hypothetical protein
MKISRPVVVLLLIFAIYIIWGVFFSSPDKHNQVIGITIFSSICFAVYLWRSEK